MKTREIYRLSENESDIKNFILDKIILNSLQGTFYERLFSLRNRKRVHDSGVKATKWRMIVHVLEMVETKRRIVILRVLFSLSDANSRKEYR